MAMLNLKGDVLKSIGQKGGKDNVSAAISHQGKLLHAVTEDSLIHCFDMTTGDKIGQVKICESEVISISSHPFSNVVAINDEAGRIYLLKPE